MFRRLIPVLLALGMTGALHADARVEVKADLAARVYFDEEFVGQTPLVLDGIQPGTHKIWIEDPTTGEMKTYAILSPQSLTVEKVIQANFQQVATTTVIQPVPPAVRAPRVWSSGTAAPVYVRTAPPPPPPPAPRARSRRERAKVHTRNTLLGLTAATQIFTDNKRDRKRQRNVGLGLTVLNEILR